MEAVRVENLTKSFGSHKVLDRLSFQVETGTICGFIGPNGSGKTTTIRILLGLLKKGGGRVQVDGVPVAPGAESAPLRSGSRLVIGDYEFIYHE